MQAAIGRANCRANVVIDLDLRRASAVELATRAKAGSDAAFQELARRLTPALRAMASNYYAKGLTGDDLHQEALVGLSEAVRDYRPDRGASFETFAKLCINRELMTAVKTALRGKHGPLNEAASLQAPRRVDETETPAEECRIAYMDRRPDAHRQLELREELAALVRCATTRPSTLEHRTLGLFLSDLDYASIAEEMGTDPKKVDNALQRGRRKLSEAMAVAA